MSDQRLNQDPWQPCPEGTLSALVDKQSKLRRREFIVHASIATLTVAAVATGTSAYLLSTPRTSPLPGGLACATVLAHLDAFASKQLDQQLTQQISVHLRECRQCHRVLTARYPGVNV